MNRLRECDLGCNTLLFCLYLSGQTCFISHTHYTLFLNAGSERDQSVESILHFWCCGYSKNRNVKQHQQQARTKQAKTS